LTQGFSLRWVTSSARRFNKEIKVDIIHNIGDLNMDITVLRLSDEVSEINRALRLLDYDWTDFDCMVEGDGTGFDAQCVRFKLYYRGLPNDDSKSEWWKFNFDGEYNHQDNLHQVTEAILDFVQNLPTGDTLKQQHMVRLFEQGGRLAEELGIDEDFINPLVGIMEKLATNAITHRK